MGKINIIEYDASGNIVSTTNNVDDPFNSYVTPNLYNENGTLAGNRTVNLAKNSLTFQGDQNNVIINGDGSLSVNDTTQSLIDIVVDEGFDDNSKWTINNTYPGTNSGTVTAGELQLIADNTAGYNEWRITNAGVYPADARIMELEWELEMALVDGSAPQQIDVYVSDKSGTYYLLQADVQDSGMYSGTLTLTEQSLVSASPILKVYMSNVQTSSNKVFITKFALRLKQPAIAVKNLQGDSIVAAQKISIAPTTNLLSTSTSEFGRLFVNSSNKKLYYRPANSSTDYNLMAGDELSVTTTGTGGAATLSSGVLNVPQYQEQITLTTTGTSGAATFSSGVLNIPNYAGGSATAIDIQTAYSNLGSSIKGYGVSYPDAKANTTAFPASQTAFFVAYHLPNAQTITGVRWLQTTNGNYTASNYNGVGLYSYSGGTLTRVAQSTNDGTIWQPGSVGWKSKAFSATYSASAGTYFVAMLYSSSAVTTGPVISFAQGASYAQWGQHDFTNSARLVATITTQTALSTSYASSSLSNSVSIPLLLLY